MDFMDTIRKRRSVRKFKDKEVPEKDIAAMLEAAKLAPSGGNEQNWLFGVIRDDEKIYRLSKAAGNQEWISSAPLVFALCTELKMNLRKLDEDDLELKVNKNRFGSDFIEYLQDYPNQRNVSLLFENCNPLLPGEHIFLTAVSRGLRACWVGYLDIEKASSLLNLPEEYVCLFLMPVGYPDEEPRDLKKKSLDELVFHEEFE